jgi:Cu/Ag efflux protein CusF
MNPHPPGRRAVHLAVAAAILALAAAPAAALAQGAPTAGGSIKASTSVTVLAVDAASRHLLVKGPDDKPFTLKVGPEVRAFTAIKPGDKIAATYYRETAYAISEPGQPLPKDTETTLAGRAAKGEAPAALIANHIVVTGAVLAIDPQAGKVKVVSPKGGEVHDFDVVTPEGRQLMAKLKVGDKITAYVTEAVVISLDKG